MRATELRLFSTLLLALCAIVAATYWLVLRAEPVSPWVFARGILILLGTAACISLAFVGLLRDWADHRRHLVDQIQSSILADDDLLPLPADNLVRPLVTSVRDHVGTLRDRLQVAQVQRKDMEIQLRLADAERRQAQLMINGISDAVLVSNAFDELIVANPAAAEIFRFDMAKSSRKPVAELLADTPLADAISDMRHNHARNNRRTAEITLPLDGFPHTFSITMNSVTDADGQLSAIVTVLHDTTREKEVSRMKSEFVSHVSHELRTPLSSIKAYAELLVDGEAADDKTRQEFYHIIQSEADRLSRLIDNILNISRIEAGITQINKVPVSLTTILKEVLEVARPNAKDKSIELVDQIAPAFFQVEADRDMIYQAALNLISNAIKYTPAGGTVKIAAFGDEAHGLATVEIIDTGVGIPPEAMKHLFEKFYRVEQNKAMAKGSGLGLNLTKHMIETVHKGKLFVRSEVGKGSTFGFTLPIMQ